MCTQSKEARRIWKDAGCPSEGELFDRWVESRRAVRRRVRECAAREERRRIQKRERLFRSGAPSRFRLPQRRKKSCLKLMRDGRIVSDKEEMLKIWAQHFESLATSGVSEREELRSLAEKMQELTERSKGNEEYILDVPFTAEEVERALSRLKRRKAAGPEGLMAEHLQEAGGEVQVWLRNVLNAIVELGGSQHTEVGNYYSCIQRQWQRSS